MTRPTGAAELATPMQKLVRRAVEAVEASGYVPLLAEIEKDRLAFDIARAIDLPALVAAQEERDHACRPLWGPVGIVDEAPCSVCGRRIDMRLLVQIIEQARQEGRSRERQAAESREAALREERDGLRRIVEAHIKGLLVAERERDTLRADVRMVLGISAIEYAAELYRSWSPDERAAWDHLAAFAPEKAPPAERDCGCVTKIPGCIPEPPALIVDHVYLPTLVTGGQGPDRCSYPGCEEVMARHAAAPRVVGHPFENCTTPKDCPAPGNQRCHWRERVSANHCGLQRSAHAEGAEPGGEKDYYATRAARERY